MNLRQYALITGNYWTFTLSDGALRMLVVLHFHQLGYGALDIALLFLFYELFGVVTNLVGGWLGARVGLNRTMNIGLALQIIALGMLLAPTHWLSVPWVMAAQALSGVAKDLNKMSAKSALKTLIGEGQASKLFHWVAALTGSKNALKGVGFFLGGLLLSLLQFRGAILAMGVVLFITWCLSLVLLQKDLGKAKNKPKFSHLFSSSGAVNALAAARLFLFAARDVWFVVALPVFLATHLGWSNSAVGAFLAVWIIGYGLVQGVTPRFFSASARERVGRAHAVSFAALLALVPAAMALGLQQQLPAQSVVIGGLLLFALVFAVNSSLHSYLIVRFARADGVSLDVGFYYMANATGRLLGTVLSGWLFQSAGLSVCLWASAGLVGIASLLSLFLPRDTTP